MRSIKKIILTLAILSLLACSKLYTSESHFIQPKDFELRVGQAWVTNTGGTRGAFLRLTPAYEDDIIVTTDAKGNVSIIDKNTGKHRWVRKTKQAITSGPGIGAGKVYFGTSDAQIVALDSETGSEVWRATVPNQVLTPPVYSHDIVLVKTLGGDLIGLDNETGQEKWHYGQSSPRLVLRGSSAPVVAYPYVISGFADGRMAVVSLDKGKLLWEKRVADPSGFTDLQRMVDINADPVVSQDGIIYVASYQGKLTAISLATSEILWEHNISSDSGMVLHGNQLYITDTEGLIWAFDRHSGDVTWQQQGVKTRRLTKPIILDGYMVVADNKGFVYWVDLEDGRFAAWNFVGNDGVIASPITADDYAVILAKGGQMFALKATPRDTTS